MEKIENLTPTLKSKRKFSAENVYIVKRKKFKIWI